MPRVVPPIDGKATGNSLNPSFVESVAGFTAGVVATLVVHPFDILKTRLQLDQSKKATQWGASVHLLTRIVREEGNVTALYRGLWPNMIGNSVSWALYFLWYRNIKDFFAAQKRPGHGLSSTDYLLASGTSGVLTAICTNPIWVIKTRMISTGRNAPGAYPSMLAGITHIAREEGWRGFYRGLVPSLFGVSHGAVQFMAYEQLKNRRARQIGTRELSNWDYLLSSGISKIFAGSITYPYQVLRSRLQTYDAHASYTSTSDVVRQIWRKEGIRGFYKGLVPNIVRVLPSTCVTFLVYENTKFYIPRIYDTQIRAEMD